MPLFYKIAKDHPRLVIDSGEIMIEWSDVVPGLAAFLSSVMGADGKEKYASGADHLTPNMIHRIELQNDTEQLEKTEQLALYTTIRKNPIIFSRDTDAAYFDGYIKSVLKYCRQYRVDFYDRRDVEKKLTVWDKLE